MSPASDACLAAVADSFATTRKAILGTCRVPALVEARHAAFWLMRKRVKLSFPEIARALGGRHHTTVMYGCDRIARRLRGGDRELQLRIAAAAAAFERRHYGIPRGI